MKILIIEDNIQIRNELSTFLTIYGYEIVVLEDFTTILEDISTITPDLILLDINLPHHDGYHVCREIRKTSNVPIIIVTSRDTEMDELMSMKLGADDFIRKPYNTQILLARIERLFRQVNNDTSNILFHGDLKLDLSTARISYQDAEEALSKNELRILYCLMINKNKIVSREELMLYLWSTNIFVDDNTLSVNITRLRKKIEKIGLSDIIQTRYKFGYILV